MVSWSWNEKMGFSSQSTVLGQSSRHKYWRQFTPKCFKERTWRVYESDFMFDLSAGSWPKRSLAALWTDHIPSSLRSNPFRELVFLGKLPYITHLITILSPQFPMCPMLCLCFFCMACYYDFHSTENSSLIQWHLFIVLYRWLIIINSTIWTIKQ